MQYDVKSGTVTTVKFRKKTCSDTQFGQRTRTTGTTKTTTTGTTTTTTTTTTTGTTTSTRRTHRTTKLNSRLRQVRTVTAATTDHPRVYDDDDGYQRETDNAVLVTSRRHITLKACIIVLLRLYIHISLPHFLPPSHSITLFLSLS